MNSNCLKDLTNKLCRSKEKFTIPLDYCLKHGFSPEWSKQKNAISEFGKLVYGFLVTIPSDKHIMGVKTVQEN